MSIGCPIISRNNLSSISLPKVRGNHGVRTKLNDSKKSGVMEDQEEAVSCGHDITVLMNLQKLLTPSQNQRSSNQPTSPHGVGRSS